VVERKERERWYNKGDRGEAEKQVRRECPSDRKEGEIISEKQKKKDRQRETGRKREQ